MALDRLNHTIVMLMSVFSVKHPVNYTMGCNVTPIYYSSHSNVTVKLKDVALIVHVSHSHSLLSLALRPSDYVDMTTISTLPDDQAETGTDTIQESQFE